MGGPPLCGPFVYNGRVFTRRIDTEREGGGCTTWYLLEGPEGVVQFMMIFPGSLEPMPADVGYHSRTPRYEDQQGMGSCPQLGGDYCYYDGSTLLAQELHQKFKDSGDDPEVIWRELEEFYNDTFR